MKILITNDDGINAPGLYTLVKFARTLGEVVVCAPKIQQSGTSQGITFTRPFEIIPVEMTDFPDVEAYSIDSTPADCVRVAYYHLGLRPDLVLSGINNGLNMGEDIGYSGTAGALFEAAYAHLNGLALSCAPGDFENAGRNLPRVFDYVKERRLFDYGHLFNINIPPTPHREILVTQMGGPYFKDRFIEGEENLYTAEGYSVHVNQSNLSLDTDATMSGYITVTPLTINRTDFNVYNQIRE